MLPRASNIDETKLIQIAIGMTIFFHDAQKGYTEFHTSGVSNTTYGPSVNWEIIVKDVTEHFRDRVLAKHTIKEGTTPCFSLTCFTPLPPLHN